MPGLSSDSVGLASSPWCPWAAGCSRVRQTVTVGEMTLARLRRWREKLLDSGVSAITVAKAYQRALADEVGRMATAELAKPKTARTSGTRTARKTDTSGEPANDASPELGK